LHRSNPFIMWRELPWSSTKYDEVSQCAHEELVRFGNKPCCINVNFCSTAVSNCTNVCPCTKTRKCYPEKARKMDEWSCARGGLTIPLGTHFFEHSLKIQWIDGEAKKDPLTKNLAKEEIPRRLNMYWGQHERQ